MSCQCHKAVGPIHYFLILLFNHVSLQNEPFVVLQHLQLFNSFKVQGWPYNSDCIIRYSPWINNLNYNILRRMTCQLNKSLLKHKSLMVFCLNRLKVKQAISCFFKRGAEGDIHLLHGEKKDKIKTYFMVIWLNLYSIKRFKKGDENGSTQSGGIKEETEASGIKFKII